MAGKISFKARECYVSELERERYKRNYIAHVRIEYPSLSTDAGCFVDTSSLKPQPKHVWMKRHPGEIDLIFSYADGKNVPKKRLDVDEKRKMIGIELGGLERQASNLSLMAIRYSGRTERNI